MVQVEAAYKADIINIAEYLNTNYKDDQFVTIVKNRESTQPNMNSILTVATKIIAELSQPHVKIDGTQHTKARLGEVLKEKWKKQGNAWAIHKKYIDRQFISEEDMFLWLSKGDLKAETESEIVAAQDQALQTKY